MSIKASGPINSLNPVANILTCFKVSMLFFQILKCYTLFLDMTEVNIPQIKSLCSHSSNIKTPIYTGIDIHNNIILTQVHEKI